VLALGQPGQHTQRAARLDHVLERRPAAEQLVPRAAVTQVLQADVAALGAREPIGLVDRDRSQPAKQHRAAVGLAAQQDHPRDLTGILEAAQKRAPLHVPWVR
jgi:hypothetical protein